MARKLPDRIKQSDNKKLPGRINLLKALAIGSIGIALHALSLTVHALLHVSDGGILSLALLLETLLMGYTGGLLLLAAKKNSRPLLTGFAIITMLLPLLLMLLRISGKAPLQAVLELIFAVFVYLIGMSLSRRNFPEMLGNRMAIFLAAGLAVCLELPHFYDSIVCLKPWLFGSSYFLLFAYLIIRNQEDIDSNIFSKKHIEKAMLPRNMRRFNTTAVVVIFLLILLFFNFKPLVITLLKLLARLMLLVISAFLWLLGHLFAGQAEQQGGGAMQPSMLPGQEEALIHPFRNLIMNSFQYFLILYIAYRLLLAAFRRMPWLVRRLAAALRKLLQLPQSQASPGSGEYSDEHATIRPLRRSEQDRLLKKQLRRNRMDLESITDPAERVRHMYGSFLNMLPLLGIHREAGDTALELAGKAGTVEFPGKPGSAEKLRGDLKKELIPFTDIYDLVRYGELHPESAILYAAEEHYEKIHSLPGSRRRG